MKTRRIMQTAWTIAREAAAKFGGRAIQYIAGALRQAWAAARSIDPMVEQKKLARILDRAAEHATVYGNRNGATSRQCWYLAGLMIRECRTAEAAEMAMFGGEMRPMLTKAEASADIADLQAA